MKKAINPPQYPKMKRAGIFSLTSAGACAAYMAASVLWFKNWERLQIKDFDFGIGGIIFGLVLLLLWAGGGLLGLRFLFWGIRFLRAGRRVSSFVGAEYSWVYCLLVMGVLFSAASLALGRYIRFGYALFIGALLCEGYMIFCLIYERRALHSYPPSPRTRICALF